MRIGGFEAEDVARQVKGSDLPATIRENLVSPDRACDDLVNVVGWFVLAINLCVAIVGNRGTHEINRVTEGAVGNM
jgi:hypothetical protein